MSLFRQLSRDVIRVSEGEQTVFLEADKTIWANGRAVTRSFLEREI